MKPERLVVVSNRLPISIQKERGGDWFAKPASGGLVTALNPVLKERGGLWIGWLGNHGLEDARHLINRGERELGYKLVPVELTGSDVELYYRGFSNEVIWPLFHDMISRCNFRPAYWPAYISVNGKFARAISRNTSEGDYIWVQDYHLMHVAKSLKEKGVQRKLGFFLHIPFPSIDMFLKLPWRREILDALLHYDIVGFQTLRDRRNFINCVRAMFDGTRSKGSGYFGTLTTLEHKAKVGTFPISIDYKDFARRAASEEVSREAERVRALFPGRKLMLGMDRLDYSKGIPHRIRAFRDALTRYPELRRKITFLQVVVPSRTKVSAYQDLKDEIDRLVGSVNGRFTQTGWTPIHYIFRPVTQTELLALYREGHIALVTPLKDGMNLVAKEFCACSTDEMGCLILSEFAGAASQLNNGAIIVNPFDLEATADAIYQAFTLSEEEQRKRMRKMRRSIRRNDIYRWVKSFLESATSLHLTDFRSFYEAGTRVYPQTRKPRQTEVETELPVGAGLLDSSKTPKRPGLPK